MLATPDMTALWYEYQKEIEVGNRTKDNFLFSVKNDIEVEIERIKSGEEFKMEVNNSGIKCPNCNVSLKRDDVVTYKNIQAI